MRKLMAREFMQLTCCCKAQSQNFTQVSATPRSSAAPSTLITTASFSFFFKTHTNGFISEVSFYSLLFFSSNIIYLRLSMLINFTYFTYLSNNIHFMNILHRWMFKSFPMFYYYNVQYLALCVCERLFLGYITISEMSQL